MTLSAKLVTIEKDVMSGTPCVRGRRIPTYMVRVAWMDGWSLAQLAKDWECEVTLLEDALRFEMKQAARGHYMYSGECEKPKAKRRKR
jgi:uncharacterized protein (DUF433 family)